MYFIVKHYRPFFLDEELKRDLFEKRSSLQWLPYSCFQYSEKEDKYEEEIKILSDKLKEVWHVSQEWVKWHCDQ